MAAVGTGMEAEDAIAVDTEGTLFMQLGVSGTTPPVKSQGKSNELRELISLGGNSLMTAVGIEMEDEDAIVVDTGGTLFGQLGSAGKN